MSSGGGSGSIWGRFFPPRSPFGFRRPGRRFVPIYSGRDVEHVGFTVYS